MKLISCGISRLIEEVFHLRLAGHFSFEIWEILKISMFALFLNIILYEFLID